MLEVKRIISHLQWIIITAWPKLGNFPVVDKLKWKILWVFRLTKGCTKLHLALHPGYVSFLSTTLFIRREGPAISGIDILQVNLK